MRTLERGGRIRLRAGALLVAMLAIVIAAVAAATMGVQAQTTPDPVAPRTVDPTDGDLSGRYLGSQDDVRFGMALQQDGTFLRGIIAQPLPQTAEAAFIDADSATLAGDRLFGVLSGDQIFLIRFSDPAQFWFGEVSRSATAIEMKGRWISSRGEGAWQAKSARGPKLAVTARVAPHEIDAGETTRVRYGVRVDNDGERTARSVQLDLRGLPEFYRIDSIEIVHGRMGDDLESLDGTAVAPSPLGGSLSLPLGNLRPDDSVLVRVSGAASPEDEHAGGHTTRVTASADNARSASTRVTLTVTGTLRLANAFSPAVLSAGADDVRPDGRADGRPDGHDRRTDGRPDGRGIDGQRPGIVAGRDGLVTYTIIVTAQPFDEVVVTDASIFGILRGAQVDVRGALARGNLASGLVLTPLTTARDLNSDAISVTITVTGDAGHLLPGVATRPR